jgi:hypothetical protein
MTSCSTFGTALGHPCFPLNSGTVLKRSYTYTSSDWVSHPWEDGILIDAIDDH